MVAHVPLAPSLSHGWMMKQQILSYGSEHLHFDLFSLPLGWNLPLFWPFWSLPMIGLFPCASSKEISSGHATLNSWGPNKPSAISIHPSKDVALKHQAESSPSSNYAGYDHGPTTCTTDGGAVGVLKKKKHLFTPCLLSSFLPATSTYLFTLTKTLSLGKTEWIMSCLCALSDFTFWEKR